MLNFGTYWIALASGRLTADRLKKYEVGDVIAPSLEMQNEILCTRLVLLT